MLERFGRLEYKDCFKGDSEILDDDKYRKFILQTKNSAQYLMRGNLFDITCIGDDDFCNAYDEEVDYCTFFGNKLLIKFNTDKIGDIKKTTDIMIGFYDHSGTIWRAVKIPGVKNVEVSDFKDGFSNYCFDTLNQCVVLFEFEKKEEEYK